ncbi:hypothetical protein FRC12_004897 [Ceratobasidium sp. 428]|nr:hypothetical protein FRC12_004897 [Ceratobasidium sp. 428]
MDVEMAPIPYSARSPEWYTDVLCKALRYERLKPWQLALTMDLCEGKDVFLVIGTGEGKSFLIQAPVIADAKAGQQTVGIVLVPTKGLADDQARAANDKGVKAIAVHEDNVRAWQKKIPPPSLFEEVGKGEWSLIFMGPEMLTETSFNSLIHQDGFLTHLRYFAIDEAHLTTEWSFRSSYARIVHLRNRFPAGKVVWLALSATISKREQPKFIADLGFSRDENRCTILRRPVDRLTLTYITRFRQHSNETLLDFASIIPLSAKCPSDIPITIVFAQRIELGNRLMTYLTNLLPETIKGADRRNLVLPYNSMMSMEFRIAAVEALKLGTQTRILVCSEAGSVGIDITNIQRAFLIVTDTDETFAMLCQKLGRIRLTGLAVIYFPRWADNKRRAKEDVRMRAKAQPSRKPPESQ